MTIRLVLKGKREATFYFVSFTLYFIFILIILSISVMIALGWVSISNELQDLYISYFNLILNTCVLIIFSLGIGSGINQLNKALSYHNSELEYRVQEQIEEKENLIQLLTHQLKNQLDIVSSCTNALSKHIPYDKALVQDNLKAQHSALSNLQEMIRRIWSVNARNHQFHLNIQRHNIIQIVEDVVLQLDHFLEKKYMSLEVKTNLSQSRAKYILADLEKIELIIIEVITNAIKYSPPGSSIHVFIYDQEGYTQVKIQDQGPGIAIEDQSEIFKRYKIGRTKPTQGESSTGLGLYFVKKYIEAMGGLISFANHTVKGAEFILTFRKF